MEIIKRGDIFWISRSQYRETVGSVQLADRPGVIVSNDANNANAPTVEIVYLTTAPKTDLPTHCIVKSARSTSTALCEQVTTVSTEQIGDYIGTCTLGEMAQIDACIAISLGLTLAKPEKAKSNAKDQETIRELTEALEAARAAQTAAERAMADMADRLLPKTEELDKLKAELARAKAREELFEELYREMLGRLAGK